MKSKHIDFQSLNDMIDTAIRDAEVRAYWEGLCHSDLNNAKKILKVKAKYHISFELVDKIIYNK